MLISVRDDILALLRDPVAFAATLPAGDASRWREGLKFALAHIGQHGRTLRAAQVAAWEGMAEKRTSLLLGPPGTGKTLLMAWMASGHVSARSRASLPSRVLLTGFTRESINNLYEAINPIIARHLPTVQTFLVGGETGLSTAKDRLPYLRDNLTSSPHVVGATTWGLAKACDGWNKGDGKAVPLFDLVLIDEASQMMLAQGLFSLVGLAPGGRVIVAGDDRQLPPVRPTRPEPDESGRVLGGSLYDFLKNTGINEFRLEETYRLNAPLAEPVAELFYEGHYRSVVPDRRLALRPGWADGVQEWERIALDPEYPLCVLLYDGPPCGTENPFERQVLVQLARLLSERLPAGELWKSQLAIITPHRAQNALLRKELPYNAVVDTVDRIQGRERDAILAGYSVSDPEFALTEAEFLFSSHRLNVTVTRARSKLVLLVSRRLLEAMPTDERVFDAAQQLREYVLSCDVDAHVNIAVAGDAAVNCEVRVRRFKSPPPPVLEETKTMATPVGAPLTDAQERLLDAIRQLAAGTPYNTTFDSKIVHRLGYRPAWEDFVALLTRGLVIRLSTKGDPPWAWRPANEPTPLLLCTEEIVRANLDKVLEEARGQYPRAIYEKVRDRFVWFDADGNDIFRPIAETLVAENICRMEKRTSPAGREYEAFDLVEKFVPPPDEEPIDRPQVTEPPDPPADDFVVLNALEDAEKGQINFGAYETAFSSTQLAALMKKDPADIETALGRLAQHHWVMRIGDRFRSRMSELARELRYAKQRFRTADAASRPFVVRAIQVRTIDRHKPRFDRDLSPEIAALKAGLAGKAQAIAAMDLLEPMLRKAWGTRPGDAVMVSGFQARALAELLPAYLGLAPQPRTFVVVADTGSGKTESAALPLIAGAAADRFAGVKGVKATLVYPRIRLLCNQAQRLTHYLSLLPPHQGGPLLTIGLQTGEVIPFFPLHGGTIPDEDLAKLWPWDHRDKGYEFRFFKCPVKTCGGSILLRPGPNRVDTLFCPTCGWRFAGWVGSKSGLRRIPPDFFLVVTESLHQWQQDSTAGRLFGDHAGFLPPRAVLADEIHLYSHIAGMQVGYALRRLLARVAVNAPARLPALAIGMSATLGRPAEVWNALIGRNDAREIRPKDDERDHNPGAREYFFFIQPVVESRNKRVPGVATTIQSLMCLAHGMRRRDGERGGFRGILFVDSIDQVIRLHEDYRSAEHSNNLAKYRTCQFPLPGGQMRRECCGQPATCAAFREGECWFFAARAPGSAPPAPNDPYQMTVTGPYVPGRPLSVMRGPVYSGAKGRIEEAIRNSDLVVATSSLEVGYDDPEMILVYQHYAPVNLASFIQRKGRAGRSSDDRPVTGVTLSVYSPRDWWYFRHPDAMLNERDFEVPLNPGNVFVRRGQALSALLDAAARSGREMQPRRENLDELFALISKQPTALSILRAVAGDLVAELKCADLSAFWRLATRNAREGVFTSWRSLLPWVPQQLFDDINLPRLRVSWPPANANDQGNKEEDIALAFDECAPGNSTRRFNPSRALWLPPPDPGAVGTVALAPPLGSEGYDDIQPEPLLNPAQLDAAGGDERAVHRMIMAELPGELADRLGTETIYHELCRPLAISLQLLGKFDLNGRWESRWYWDKAQRRVVEGAPPSPAVAVHHKSSSELLGFPMLRVAAGRAKQRLLRGLPLLARSIDLYQGDPAGEGRTGLSVARVFWGAEISLRCGPRGQDVINWSFTFTDPQRQPRLHGYLLETEGVRLTPDSEELNKFVAAELERVAIDAPWSRWLHGQFFRYLLATRFAAAGLSNYAAGPLADLFVAARAVEALQPALLEQWKRGVCSQALEALLRQAHAEVLSLHPFLSDERLEEHLQEIHHPRFAEVFTDSISDCADPVKFASFVRTLVLHGLALSLQELFVLHGRGDERRVLLHARLPVQFTEPSDTLSVFEAGDHGDGTTRTFDRHRDAAFAGWRRGELGDCPFAAEDAITEQLFGCETQHSAWREAGAPDAAGLGEISLAVTGTRAVSEVHQQRLRAVLFDEELVGSRSFPLYELVREIRAVRAQLREAFRRRPSAWELVSAAVTAADAADPLTPWLTKLLSAYAEELDIGSDDEAIGPRGRLADQVYRLGAALCVDGCRGCLHRSSSLMSEEQTAATISREVLARYREWVLAPMTVRVQKMEDIPANLDERLRQHGTVRILIAPTVYEASAPRLQALGFSSEQPGGFDPVYDPLLSAVVCIRELTA
jgi:hypothetical protein